MGATEIPGWEIYNSEAMQVGESDNARRIRCDQLVIVTAEDEVDAIEKAKAEASDINMDGYCIDNVSLWVDEGIDVKLKLLPARACDCH